MATNGETTPTTYTDPLYVFEHLGRVYEIGHAVGVPSTACFPLSAGLAADLWPSAEDPGRQRMKGG